MKLKGYWLSHEPAIFMSEENNAVYSVEKWIRKEDKDILYTEDDNNLYFLKPITKEDRENFL